MQRTKLSDPNTGEQRQQHAKLAGVHIIQQVGNEARLLIAGQHPHFLFPRLGVIDLDSRKSSGEKCCCVFQNTVQNDKHIMHGLRSQLILEKQLLGEVVDQASRHAHGKAAAELRLDVFPQSGVVFYIGRLLHFGLSHTQPFVTVERKAVPGVRAGN